MKVYLAGPITGLTHEGADQWREKISTTLEENGVTPLSPLRAEKFLKSYGILETSYIGATPMVTDRGMVTRDFWDVSRSDAVIVNLLGASRVSIGTMFEMAWCLQLRKPTICVIEAQGNPHEHSFVREAIDYRVETLEEAVSNILILKEA
jgi:nucleoside 2-deoxyribosyltransferase